MFYIERHLITDEHLTFLQSQFDFNTGCKLVIAEPGAGKSELLNNIAKQLGTEVINAKVFQYTKDEKLKTPLIIDGLDEVAKVGKSKLEEVISKACNTSIDSIIFATRSSEWRDSNTKFLKQFRKDQISLLRLAPFNEEEQATFVKEIKFDVNFNDFKQEVASVEMAPLLGNPLFLRMLATAYIESDGSFNSKRDVFENSIQYLAKEHNTDIESDERPSYTNIIREAESLFCSLLLSGCAGITLKEGYESDLYPFIKNVTDMKSDVLKYLFDTQLFKFSGSLDKEEPIHRVIQEYCAAKHLVRLIHNPSVNVSLKRCAAIISPNSVIRDDLKGLVGWMAALGNQEIQQYWIRLDPYSILANGDPSRLTLASKKLLLQKLKEISTEDPYFRGSDRWRNFAVKDFFGNGIQEEVKEILIEGNDNNHLLSLLLELLNSEESPNVFELELTGLIKKQSLNKYTRLLALDCLFHYSEYGFLDLFNYFLRNGNEDDLYLASQIVNDRSCQIIGVDNVLKLLGKLPSLYPASRDEDNTKVIGERYFISHMISLFDLESVYFLLNNLSQSIVCVCGIKEEYECYCRDGVSKTVGKLLDRYFDLIENIDEPMVIWNWIKNLHFHGTVGSKNSLSVKVLSTNHNLRRQIILCSLEGLNNAKAITDRLNSLGFNMGHSGLSLHYDDNLFLAETSFNNCNICLWESMYIPHPFYSKERGENLLRTLLRQHANSNNQFLSSWCRLERNSIRNRKKYNYPSTRKRNKWEFKKLQHKENTHKQFNASKELILQGTHIGWLSWLADGVLIDLDRFNEYGIDWETVQQALINSIDNFKARLPLVTELAINTYDRRVVRVFFAANLIFFRLYNTLPLLDEKALSVLKTQWGGGYKGIAKEESEAIFKLIDQKLFVSKQDLEKFSREFFQTQLESNTKGYISLSMLYDELFNPVRDELCLEWLNKFSSLPSCSIQDLFNLCMVKGNLKALSEIILSKCEHYNSKIKLELDIDEQCKCSFWYIRAYIFIDYPPEYIGKYLFNDKDNVFLFESIFEDGRRSNSSNYPLLTANKVADILRAYIGEWPKVNLPNHWGSGSPTSERAYRFITNFIWRIMEDKANDSLIIIDELLSDDRFKNFESNLLHMKSSTYKRKMLEDFTAPSCSNISQFLKGSSIASIEDLRAFLVEQLISLQVWLREAPTDPIEKYYSGSSRVSENTARNRLVEDLRNILLPHGYILDIETHMSKNNRCDITVKAKVGLYEFLLVIEVKGQWHEDLYDAAQKQLYERYSQHPNAAEQGIYLVFWFGESEKVAKRKNHGIRSATELKDNIMNNMPSDLLQKIDVVVMDVSKS